MADIKVKDDEYGDVANKLSKLGSDFVVALQQYSQILEYITANSLKSAAMSAALRNNSQSALAAKDTIEMVNERLEKECREFISSIDEADQYLYS